MVGAEAYLGESITEKGVEGALDLGDVEALGDLADDIANFSDQRALVDGCTFVSRVFTRSVGAGSCLPPRAVPARAVVRKVTTEKRILAVV